MFTLDLKQNDINTDFRNDENVALRSEVFKRDSIIRATISILENIQHDFPKEVINLNIVAALKNLRSL